MITRIEQLHKSLVDSIFTIHAPLNYTQIQTALVELAVLLDSADTDESIWWIGGDGWCDLGSLITGAYWHFTLRRHTGPYSQSYLIVCALGRIFSPGMSDGPEEGSSEHDCYLALNDLFLHSESIDNDHNKT